MAKDKVIPSNLVLCNEKFKYDNVEQMVNDTGLQLDNVVELLGYYQAGDGEGHQRIIASEDDGSGVQLGNGLWANVVKNSYGVNKGEIEQKQNKIDEGIDFPNHNIVDAINNNYAISNYTTRRPRMFWKSGNEIRVAQTRFAMNGFRFMGQFEKEEKKIYKLTESQKTSEFIGVCNSNNDLAWTNTKPLSSWVGIFVVPKNETECEFKLVPFMQVKSASEKVITLAQTKERTWASENWSIELNDKIDNKKALIITQNRTYIGAFDKVVSHTQDTITLENLTLSQGDYLLVAPSDEYCYIGSTYIDTAEFRNIGDDGIDVFSYGSLLQQQSDWSQTLTLNTDNLCSPLATSIYLGVFVLSSNSKLGSLSVSGGIDSSHVIPMYQDRKYGAVSTRMYSGVIKINFNYKNNFALKITEEISNNTNDVDVRVWGWTEC